jgi:hypothetical protein
MFSTQNFISPQLLPFQKILQKNFSPFEFTLVSINSTKLQGDIEPTLKSLSQFLLAKNQLF